MLCGLKLMKPVYRRRIEMIKDILTTTKMLTYSLKFKMQMVLTVFLFAVGMLLYVMEPNFWVSYFYIFIPGMFVVQMYHYLMISDLVKSSPYNRKLQIKMPVAVSFIMTTFAFTVDVILGFIRYLFMPPEEIDFSFFFSLAVINFFFLIYLGFVYKYFWFSMAVVLVVLCPIVFFSSFTQGLPPVLSEWISTCPAYIPIITGYVLIICGAAIEYVLLKALYHKPYSKYAFGAMYQ